MGFDSWDMYNVGEHSLYPGPIDNSGLFSGKTVIRPKFVLFLRPLEISVGHYFVDPLRDQ